MYKIHTNPVIIVHFYRSGLMSHSPMRGNTEEMNRILLALAAGEYNRVKMDKPLTTLLTGAAGEFAEEIFDLTNNPDREDEVARKVFFGNRSLSSGDIVQVNDELWVCCSIGWAQLIAK